MLVNILSTLINTKNKRITSKYTRLQSLVFFNTFDYYIQIRCNIILSEYLVN